MAYEQIKHRIMPTPESHTAFRNMIAGSLAGCTSVFFSYPLDLLRVRLAFEVRSTDAVRLADVARIIYNEPTPFLSKRITENTLLKPLAGLSNFYRGFMPTLYGIIPYAGVSFLVYERLKTLARTSLPRTLTYDTPDGAPKLTWWAYLTCGALSGVIAQTTAYPFEVIRRNMQVAGTRDVSHPQYQTPDKPRRNTRDTARHIWVRKGWRGFFVGLSIGYMKVMPMSAVSFFVYEWTKNRLGID
ncbi:hypothetical protein HKX48_002745 [Thoreauomyces humboldtii]|nr:hypothetical protein HKX48_002745 [Thoreauomyces humboldtii]